MKLWRQLSGSQRILIVLVAVIAVVIVVNALSKPTADSGSASDYVDRYGGSDTVYAQIAADTDCDSLQETFDRAAANNDTAAAGSAEARWTTGYMTAADERMRAIGCY